METDPEPLEVLFCKPNSVKLSLYPTYNQSNMKTEKVRDILKQVTTEIAIYSKAETNESLKINRNNIRKLKTSLNEALVPVTRLKQDRKIMFHETKPLKLDTQQFVTDTQLIAITDGIEALEQMYDNKDASEILHNSISPEECEKIIHKRENVINNEPNFNTQTYANPIDEQLLQNPKANTPKNSMILNTCYSLDAFENFANDMLSKMNEQVHDNTEFEDSSDKSIEKDKIFLSFTTASNKSIEISRSSYEKAEHIFDDFDLRDTLVASGDDYVSTKKPDFHDEIANNEIETIAADCENYTKKECDLNAKEIVTDKAENMYKHINSEEIDARKIIHDSQAFNSANSREIIVSDKSRVKHTQIFDNLIDFQDIDINNFKEFNPNDNDYVEPEFLLNRRISADDVETERVSKDLLKFEGFKTASDKKVQISSKALERAKSLFEGIDIDLSTTSQENYINKEFDFGRKEFQNNPGPSRNFYENNNELLLSGNNNQSVLTEKYINNTNKNCQNFLILSGYKIADGNEIEISNNGSNNADRFIEFKPASNKKLIVSKEAMKKSKDILKDLECVKENWNFEELQSDDIKDFYQTSEPNFAMPLPLGFKTANSKEIQVSKAAREKTKNIFNDLTEPEQCSGLKIANKRVQISKQALEKTKDNFNDFTENLDKAPSFVAFKTANNRDIQVSKQALQKTKDIFNDFTENLDKAPSFVVFKTANNRDIQVLKPALEKTKDIFNDFTEDLNKVPSFVGFKTANNRDIQVSKQALEKTKEIFNDFTEDLNKVPSLVGFKTANNRDIQVSKQALEKTKEIFIDITEDLNKVPSFIGFKTANNRDIQVSKQALEKTKAIFNDFNEVESINKLNYHEYAETIGNEEKSLMFGFKTATDKEKQISKEALEISKNLFYDLNEIGSSDKLNIHESSGYNLKVNDTLGEKPLTLGFKTANNKEIRVSKEHLEKIKGIFSDIIELKPEEVSFTTDKTKESLVKTKQFLEEFTISTNSKEKSPETLKKKVKFSNISTSIDISNAKNISSLPESDEQKENISNFAVEITNLKHYVDTQAINDFQNSLNTEDFDSKPQTSMKKPGSPILFCPNAKKRKSGFKTPYKHAAKKSKIVETQSRKIDKVETLSFKYDFAKDYKKSKRFKLKDLEIMEKSYDFVPNIDSFLTEVDTDNPDNIVFRFNRNQITDNDLKIEDLKSIFMKSVDTKIVPKQWFEIQLKNIIWKLISYELKFPNCMRNVLNAKNILEQLKYRYDKELENFERPILRKILEKDAPSFQPLVLYVSKFVENNIDTNCIQNENSNIELLISDGWYSIKAAIDNILKKQILNGNIKIGTKIITVFAELSNCEQGVSPFEDTSSVRLKIHANSTRKAAWDLKLGAYTGSGPSWSLSGARPRGGPIPFALIRVTRVYPFLYIEKTANGFVTRSERMESLHSMHYESEREKAIEQLYEKIEKELASDEYSDDSESLEVLSSRKRKLESGSQIAKLMKTSTDSQEFRANLTESQRQLLDEHNSRKREERARYIEERIREEISKSGLNKVNRSVVTLLKVRGVACDRKGVKEEELTKCMLSIWKPSEYLQDIIVEGHWIEVRNVTPSGYRMDEIQISAGNQSIFSKSKKERNECSTEKYLRKCHRLAHLSGNVKTVYDEIDTAGLIIHIQPNYKEFEAKASKNSFQNVYLADSNENIIVLIFWGGVKKFGYEKILETCNFVACTNLQRRSGNTYKKLPQYRATDYTTFTATPRNENLKNELNLLKNEFKSIDIQDFCKNCNEKITFNESTLIKSNISENNFTKNMFSNMATPRNDFNVEGLDFDSTFKQTQTDRTKAKIAKLKIYGKPPPISSYGLLNKSKEALKPYRSPLNQNMTSHCDMSNDTAPILNDRSGRKVDFNQKCEDFDTDFDCSLPLSLE